jgi:hypothetical protein
VNNDGSVNEHHKTFLEKNGGHVGPNVKVSTPVKCTKDGCSIKK